MKIKILILLLLSVFSPLGAIKTVELKSPDQRTNIQIIINKDIAYSVLRDNDTILNKSLLAMSIEPDIELCKDPKLIKTEKKTVNQKILSPFYKKTEISDYYNQVTLYFKGYYQIIFRAYNDGVAYRFITNMNGKITISNETVALNIPGNPKIYASYVNSDKKLFEEQFFNSFESLYTYDNIENQNDKKLKLLPLLSELKNGKKLCITEADLTDYPGMFLNNSKIQSTLRGIFAPVPKIKKQGGHNNLQMLVTERENYIAKTSGKRSFPWRVFIISDTDRELTNSDMVYRLAEPNKIENTSWIKPGKVAWDWWNDWNIKNVNFKSGINNKTYKYYIDFASENHIEYIIMDEGWSVKKEADLLKVIPEIDLKEIIDYAKRKNVGVILWAGYWALHRDMENVVKHYSEMGVKGFKIDFLDRDDQEMVDFTHEAAKICAKYKMLVDFHGVFKPTGLQRTYPNVLNYEAVAGLEQMKWQPNGYDMITHDVTIPFIRMIAGPLDYTQGAMRNATPENYYPVSGEPMSQGTRVRQLAEYVVFESPINMMCDSPTSYMKEQECTDFISSVPTVWDETIPIDGKVSQYIAIARRSGNLWYVGAMTNHEERTLELDLSFLPEGNYKAEIFCDGVNTDRIASDYQKKEIKIPSDRKINILMKSGGGYIAKIYKR